MSLPRSTMPVRAISIRQPYVELILRRKKRREYHAQQKYDSELPNSVPIHFPFFLLLAVYPAR